MSCHNMLRRAASQSRHAHAPAAHSLPAGGGGAQERLLSGGCRRWRRCRCRLPTGLSTHTAHGAASVSSPRYLFSRVSSSLTSIYRFCLAREPCRPGPGPCASRPERPGARPAAYAQTPQRRGGRGSARGASGTKSTNNALEDAQSRMLSSRLIASPAALAARRHLRRSCACCRGRRGSRRGPPHRRSPSSA